MYLGEHRYLNTQVALKLLHNKINLTDVEDILTEARQMCQLIHPNIIRLLDFGMENDIPYLVMDYAPGGTLRERHPSGTVALPEVISYVRDVASGLHYIHETGVIHRNLKPENLLIGRIEEILLCDFGIALISSAAGSTHIPEMFGSLAYMAPEQIRGMPQPASDQHSLAMMVYEWLCGTLPFHGSTTELKDQHLYATPQPIHLKNPAIPIEVEQVVMQALSKDPESRFPDVQSFAEALARNSTQQSPYNVGYAAGLASKRDKLSSQVHQQPRFKNIPAWNLPLIGREQERQTVRDLLERPEIRLVTLTGTGGIGKTRLAAQVGTDLQEEFAHGVCFVQLAPIRDPELVLPTIAHALSREMKSQDDIGRALWGSGHLFLRDGNLKIAQSLFKESISMLKANWQLARNKWAMASCLERLGEIAHVQGQPIWTIKFFAAAESVRTANGFQTLLGIDQPYYDRILAQARTKFDKKTCTALWNEGRRMILEQVLNEETKANDTNAFTFSAHYPTSETTPYGQLTRREFEVLRVLAQGSTNAQIAEKLIISLSTVDTHIRSIYNKLGVSSRVQATRYAIENHII